MLVTKHHQFGQHIWDIELSNFGFAYTVSLHRIMGTSSVIDDRHSGLKEQQ